MDKTREEDKVSRPIHERRGVARKTAMVATTKLTLSGTPRVCYVGGDILFLPTISGDNNTGIQFSATSLPPGAEINASTGTITGKALRAGTYNTVISAKQSGTTVTLEAPFEVLNVLKLEGQPHQGYMGAHYAYAPRVSYTGDKSQITFSATNLPEGLSINDKTGLVSGTPTGVALGKSYITATDNCSTVSLPVSFNIALSIIVTGNPAPAPINSYYQFVPTIQNVTLPGSKLTAKLISGTLPTGLTLNENSGIIMGIPTTEGVSNVEVEFSNGFSSTIASFTFKVTAPLSVVSSTFCFPTYFFNTETVQLINASSGANYSYQIVGGSLPWGITLTASNGMIGGTPYMPGIYPVVVEVTDGNTRVLGNITIQIREATLEDFQKQVQGPNSEYPTLESYILASIGGTYTLQLMTGVVPEDTATRQLLANFLMIMYVRVREQFTIEAFTKGLAEMPLEMNLWTPYSPNVVATILPYATFYTSFISKAQAFYKNFYNSYNNPNTPVNKCELLRTGCRASVANYLKWNQYNRISQSLQASQTTSSGTSLLSLLSEEKKKKIYEKFKHVLPVEEPVKEEAKEETHVAPEEVLPPITGPVYVPEVEEHPAVVQE